MATVLLNIFKIMRLWMILGGLLGFVIGIGFGLAQGTAWSTIIWRASVTACIGGFVFRWWGSIWVKSFYQAQQEQWSVPQKPQTTVAPAKPRV
jgi:phosphotransferase system  glucose/maltose/N-acetylglucosamine-specific IIC component